MATTKEYRLFCLENPLLGKNSLSWNWILLSYVLHSDALPYSFLELGSGVLTAFLYFQISRPSVTRNC
jgi:hypothetical protein